MSLEDCARLCDKNTKIPEKICMSIEWSPSSRNCRLLNTAIADGPQQDDYILCIRGIYQNRALYSN